MAVYAWCGQCNRRRDAAKPGSLECEDKVGHKRFLGWVADTRLGRRHRDYKLFNFKLKNPKELADAHERGLKTDRQRGVLQLDNEQAECLFGALADKYWTEHALVEGRKPERHTFYAVEKAKKWLGENRKVGPFTKKELEVFQDEMRSLQRRLRGQGLAGSTVNRYFNIIRSIMERGRVWGLLTVNPMEFVAAMQEEEPALRFLEQKEIDHLFATAANLQQESQHKIELERIQRLVDYMTVVSHTGARPSSIKDCSFDNGDVDLANRIIWFTTYKGAKTKKKHRYPVPIDDVLFPLIVRRAEETGRRGPVFDCRSIRELEVMAIEQSKLNEGKPEDQWFTMYGLKHCYASHLLMNGATLFDVAKLLGHTDIRMVQKHYGHLTMDHLRKVQGKINLTPTVQLKVV
jgi:integrase